ncbi:3-deoxy-D-manno-octulosonate 8-phosphate phosphatase, YrbI family protein [Collimonas arenae]|uniref:3-deoxy-D-manno-octulosonate 8-phosphate phosphatase KdsC n=1 Tax=Collimonas arenae TaxID=279058 RepID=A0A127QDW8_9BURK|nr:HAD family hydrolase [Collimonas arenae]AMP08201.1 3-deoxy-D-manno-octulosonate 8-phosphate phosphatase, YrbI family protein [Collimonas arenae]
MAAGIPYNSASVNSALPEAELMARAARVRLMIFDVDGILTDGGLLYGADGEQLKRFNVLDGHGIKQLQQSGVATAIISARKSAVVSRRAADLGIAHVQQGVHDKHSAFIQLLAQLQLDAEACGFIGDDVIDLPILSQVGFAASVPNGHREVRARVHYVTQTAGGQGAAREVCDLIMQAQNTYEAALAAYLRPTPQGSAPA